MLFVTSSLKFMRYATFDTARLLNRIDLMTSQVPTERKPTTMIEDSVNSCSTSSSSSSINTNSSSSSSSDSNGDGGNQGMVWSSRALDYYKPETVRQQKCRTLTRFPRFPPGNPPPIWIITVLTVQDWKLQSSVSISSMYCTQRDK